MIKHHPEGMTTRTKTCLLLVFGLIAIYWQNSVRRSLVALRCHGSGVDKELSHFRRTKKCRSKRFLSPCTYYANCISRQQIELLRSGDIELNPGPKRNSRKCQVCEKTIRKNQQNITCKICFDDCHLKCIQNMNLDKDLKTTSEDFTCQRCLWNVLPFLKIDFMDVSRQSELEIEFQDEVDRHLAALTSRPKHMKFMHLNTQSVLSSLDELILTVEKCPFDIVTMSETWLKDNPQLLNYVKIPGYSQEFRNRNNLRGGGVGAYIIESLKYKRRKDIENLEPDLEHLWLEIPGRNKHSKLLLGTMYRSEKILPLKDWQEKFESILSHLTTTWDGLIVVSGDMNIDLNDNNSSTKKNYMEMLSALNFHQHVNKATRTTNKTSTLIDHIISNASDRISYTDVLPCPLVSDHDAVYACVNIKVPKFEKRYKFIRHEKYFTEEDL